MVWAYILCLSTPTLGPQNRGTHSLAPQKTRSLWTETQAESRSIPSPSRQKVFTTEMLPGILQTHGVSAHLSLAQRIQEVLSTTETKQVKFISKML